MAQHLAERIPCSDLRVYKGEGRLIVPKHWERNPRRATVD
jgi:hypothetical protein